MLTTEVRGNAQATDLTVGDSRAAWSSPAFEDIRWTRMVLKKSWGHQHLLKVCRVMTIFRKWGARDIHRVPNVM